jgi:D-alanyl-D-alanine carboxypeptidase
MDFKYTEFTAMLKKYCFFLIMLFASLAEAKPHYASIVLEYPSLNVLYSENAATANQPASLTKVMTLYLVFKALDKGKLKMDQPLHVSAHAASRQPSKLGLNANDTLTVEQAVSGLVTKSANDAASVLAESLALTEDDFAILMTNEARRLGMYNTTFKNASGIANNQQLTTATDMAIMGAAMLRDYPHYYHYFSLKQFNYRSHVFKNHNHLLGKYDGCDGIKTGFTIASGFNLLSSATRNGHRLIAVVLGGNSIKSRDLRTMQLLDTGFAKLAASGSNKKLATLPNNEPEVVKLSDNLEPELEMPNTSLEEEY